MPQKDTTLEALSPLAQMSRSLELFNSAMALEQSGNYNDAFQLLEQCDQSLTTQPADQALNKPVKLALWRLHPQWWATLQHGGLSLRRCQASDADFFKKTYADRQFSQQFNRQQPWFGPLDQALQQAGQLPPLQTGSVIWVVESATSGAIGLASLSSLDTQNRRVELSVGLPGAVTPTLGIKATVMILHFAMWMMPFNKVYCYIYEDNQPALQNALRLGFLHEGTSQDHFFIDGQGFVTVNQLGLTRQQAQSNAKLKTLAKRMIGRAW